MKPMARVTPFPTVLLLAFALALGARAAVAAPRVVVLGFDGVDPVLMERYIAAGEMPVCARMVRGDRVTRLATTCPAQSPVSWSAFSIGANPGKTGIFDFLTRAKRSYLPEMALVGVERLDLLSNPRWRLAAVLACGLLGLLPGLVLRARGRFLAAGALLALTLAAAASWYTPSHLDLAVSRRDGVSFWRTLADQGLRVTVLTVPVTFPAEELGPNGRLLSGLGVPDIRRTQGTYCCFQDVAPANANTEMGGRLQTVAFKDGEAEAFIPGPPAGAAGNLEEASARLRIRREASGQLTLEHAGGVERLEPGRWSDWTHFTFSLNPLMYLAARGRFLYVSPSDPFKLYLSPLNFDPGALPFIVKLSWPTRYAGELEREHGPYKTLGWAVDTWAATEGVLDEKAFMEDLNFTYDGRERLVMGELAKSNWDCLVAVFEETDRVSHLFWKGEDPRTPPAAPPATRPILATYKRVDATIGKVLEKCPDATVFVLSDHGFHAFRRKVNLNSWLESKGFLVRKPRGGPEAERNLLDLYEKHDIWADVDWDRTKAYSMGLGNIFINVMGREPRGAVQMGAAYARVRKELTKGLLEMTDPADGARPVRNVYRREEVYEGPHTTEAPDLLVGFADGYRVSWQAALGGVEPEVVSANEARWCGDHCSLDPPAIPGVLLSNRRLESGRSPAGPSVMDLAPTVLAQFGLRPPAEMDGRAMRVER